MDKIISRWKIRICTKNRYCIRSSKRLLTFPRYFHTHNLKGISAIISAFRWAERSGRFWICALQSARKVNWSRCFSPARCTIADCPYAGVPIWGVLLWGLAGGIWRPDTYHRDRILEDRGAEMPREYSFERRHEIEGRAMGNSHSYS